MKGRRFVYVVVSLESCILGVVIYIISFLGESVFLLVLGFSLISSVLGLLVIVMMLTCYGTDYVRF